MSKELNLSSYLQRATDRLRAMAETDPQIAAITPRQDVFDAMREAGTTYQDVIARVCDGYSERPVFGVRAYELQKDAQTGETVRNHLPAFETITFNELRKQVEAIASAWQSDELRVLPGDYVFYISFAGAEMTAIDLAAIYAQAISVPVQANLPEPDMLDILRDVGPVTMVGSIEYLDLTVAYCQKQETIRTLVVIDADERVDADRRTIERARAVLAADGGRVQVLTFAELVARGKDKLWTPLPRPERGTDNITTIIYTSGSTGTPKGALIHEAQCLQFWRGMDHQQPYISVCFAPQNHFVGRCMVWNAIAQGGTVYFSLKSDMSTLLEDIRLTRPTFLYILPRFTEIIYQHYQSELQRRVALGGNPDEVDAEVRAEMRASYLGDRLVAGTVGSAPTSPEVRQFITECFDIAFVEGYGSTEQGSGGTTWANRIVRSYVIDYKLRDVPELGYYTTDKPYPRGELLVKTYMQFQGYFKRPDATASVFDEDGFLITGDIMEEREPEVLYWLDRRNNVIKLSQSEFVAIGPLETQYLAGDALLRQIYIYGNSQRSYLLAVVVPDLDVARERLGGRAPTDDDLRTMALQALQAIGRAGGLKSFEVPRDVLIEREPFTLENGLLSSVRKPLRPRLKARYGDALKAIYAAMDAQQQRELAQLRAGGGDLSTVDRLAGALKASLGLAAIDPDGPQSYRDLGGDSLGAVSFSLLLEEMFGVVVPVGTILEPTGTGRRLAAFIDTAMAGGATQASFASVHGKDATAALAADLKLSAFIDEATLIGAETALPPSEHTRTVLMTGATGHLGRFLALNWLDAVAATGGKLICIVRASDNASARARLVAELGTLDAAMLERFHRAAEGHLEVLSGDLAAPGLGLSGEDFARLAAEVDLIVHPGALVNHRLSYRNLFEPNVVGTAELIRLALTTRLKRFSYVSTIAVPYLGVLPRAQCESSDVRVNVARVPVSEGYAEGYAASKWGGEVLLQEANEHYGLPVHVYRPNMILGQSQYRGQINLPDMFTRLVYSIIATGLAPASFYDGDPRLAHYDGQPVDFLADAMQQISGQAWQGSQTFNSVNVNYDDGVSLDSVVDWIESAGFRVQRIADHAEWMRRFEEKLHQLDDTQKALSAINILGHHAHPHPAQEVPFESDAYVAALAAMPRPAKVPHLTEAYIHKFLKDMQAHSMIEAPLAVPA